MESTETKEEEEILFIEDRRPGIMSPVKFKPVRIKTVEKSQEFIPLENENCRKDSHVDKTDEGKTEEALTIQNTETTADHVGEGTLQVIEDRDPQLTGQETSSPKYTINRNFLKLHENEELVSRKKLGNTCWNCGETTHVLRDCPLPRNYAHISQCRKEFQDSKGSSPVYKRYHVHERQAFSHLIPGQLSSNLREALGLEPRQLPSHIYRMRRLGYPPGWLLEAKVSHSGIAMFDGTGKEIADPEGTEAGEVVEKESRDKYEIGKIIHYPGFNIPPPPDTYDDSAYWRCPPFSQQQSVEIMVARLDGRIVGGYKRKKMSLAATSSDPDKFSHSAEFHDMDYEEIDDGVELPEDNCKFVPPLPEEDLPPPPPLELPGEPSETDTDSQPLPSTLVEDQSLTELEEQKKLLLAQLNDTTQVCSTPKSRIGKVKSKDLGTPLLKSVSPYSRLPSQEKFSVNICDVINFENLPDSTGKYDKMSDIIRKVRVKLSKMNNEM